MVPLLKVDEWTVHRDSIEWLGFKFWWSWFPGPGNRESWFYRELEWTSCLSGPIESQQLCDSDFGLTGAAPQQWRQCRWASEAPGPTRLPNSSWKISHGLQNISITLLSGFSCYKNWQIFVPCFSFSSQILSNQKMADFSPWPFASLCWQWWVLTTICIPSSLSLRHSNYYPPAVFYPSGSYDSFWSENEDPQQIRG